MTEPSPPKSPAKEQLDKKHGNESMQVSQLHSYPFVQVQVGQLRRFIRCCFTQVVHAQDKCLTILKKSERTEADTAFLIEWIREQRMCVRLLLLDSSGSMRRALLQGLLRHYAPRNFEASVRSNEVSSVLNAFAWLNMFLQLRGRQSQIHHLQARRPR
jgi:hypothetical protein